MSQRAVRHRQSMTVGGSDLPVSEFRLTRTPALADASLSRCSSPHSARRTCSSLNSATDEDVDEVLFLSFPFPRLGGIPAPLRKSSEPA